MNGKCSSSVITSLTIPTFVTHIRQQFFSCCKTLQSLTIPSTVKFISKSLLQSFNQLTNLTMPFGENEIVWRSELCSKLEGIDQKIVLPDSIKILNGKTIEKQTAFSIQPKTISLSDCSFLSSTERNLLEQFCEKSVDAVVFDSTIHEWSVSNSQFGKAINNKSNLAIVVEDAAGNIFGYYITSTIDGFVGTKSQKHRKYSGENAFHFILKSSNKSLLPQKCEIIFLDEGKHQVFSDVNKKLASFGFIFLMKKGRESDCHYIHKKYIIDYYGKEVLTLVPKKFFTMKRLVVYQMG